MSTALEQLPVAEAGLRQARCRTLLAARHPEAGGMLVFSPINIYYLTGTLGSGVVWLPVDGEPVLLVRKGIERARLESPLKHIAPFRSYSDLADVCAGVGSPLSPVMAAEKGGLSWTTAELLQARVKDVRFVDAGPVLARARAVKTPYELIKMREAGARHKASFEAVAAHIHPSMTEREIAIEAVSEMMRRDHAGIMRVTNLEGEAVFGQLAAGDNANYPTALDAPIGYVGGHSAVPYMGSAETVWARNTPLVLDFTFNYQGYHTDKTQVFWSGLASGIPPHVMRAHEVCAEIRVRAAGMLKPGVTPEQIWQASANIVAKAGLGDHFMGFGGNQIRFVGHGIGLACDEFPAIANRFDEPLEVGMTMALEPKMGLFGIGMVGMEDVFEVTPDGGRSISGDMTGIVCLAD